MKTEKKLTISAICAVSVMLIAVVIALLGGFSAIALAVVVTLNVAINHPVITLAIIVVAVVIYLKREN